MASEPIRGCGYRVVGGLYLVGDPMERDCLLLPLELKTCPVCGSGLKFSRGWTWIPNPYLFFQKEWGSCPKLRIEKCEGEFTCPFTLKPYEEMVDGKEVYVPPLALLWVGSRYYTPESFTKEAITLGISKRIPSIPKYLRLGETWVLLAHPKAVRTPEGPKPGIFMAFCPKKVEMPIYESMLTNEVKEKLLRRGITPVPVKDGDPDHEPTVTTKRRLEKLLNTKVRWHSKEPPKPVRLDEWIGGDE